MNSNNNKRDDGKRDDGKKDKGKRKITNYSRLNHLSKKVFPTTQKPEKKKPKPPPVEEEPEVIEITDTPPRKKHVDYNAPDRSKGDFYCVLCDAHMNTMTVWETHIIGKRHIKNLEKGPAGVPSKQKFESRNDLQPMIIERINKINTLPVVGLDHVTEFRRANATDPTYTCFLCQGTQPLSQFAAHLITTKHRLNYIKQVDPEGDQMISALRLRGDALDNVVEEKCRDLEQKFGRGKIEVKTEKKADKGKKVFWSSKKKPALLDEPGPSYASTYDESYIEPSPFFHGPSPPFGRRTPSPFHEQSNSAAYQRSMSPSYRQSRSPFRRSRSPVLFRRSRSPALQRSRSPALQRSRSPALQRSRSPALQRSRSPALQRSRSPALQRSRSPAPFRRSRSPVPFQRSRSPVPFQRSRSPFRKSRSPLHHESSSHYKPNFSPKSKREISPRYRHEGSPTYRRRSSRSPSPQPRGRYPEYDRKHSEKRPRKEENHSQLEPMYSKDFLRRIDHESRSSKVQSISLQPAYGSSSYTNNSVVEPRNTADNCYRREELETRTTVAGSSYPAIEQLSPVYQTQQVPVPVYQAQQPISYAVPPVYSNAPGYYQTQTPMGPVALNPPQQPEYTALFPPPMFGNQMHEASTTFAPATVTSESSHTAVEQGEAASPKIPFLANTQQEQTEKEVLEMIRYYKWATSAQMALQQPQTLAEKVENLSSGQIFLTLEAMTRSFFAKAEEIALILQVFIKLNKITLDHAITRVTPEVQMDITFKLMQEKLKDDSKNSVEQRQRFKGTSTGRKELEESANAKSPNMKYLVQNPQWLFLSDARHTKPVTASNVQDTWTKLSQTPQSSHQEKEADSPKSREDKKRSHQKSPENKLPRQYQLVNYHDDGNDSDSSDSSCESKNDRPTTHKINYFDSRYKR